MAQPNLNSDNYYEILGCPRNANDAALKKAYRKLAVKWHPDKNPDNDQATTNFQKISEAYATLHDTEKRRSYDQFGSQGADAADHMPNGGAGGFGFPPGGVGGGHFHAGGMSQEDANKIFSEFFGSSDPFGGFGGGIGGMFQGMGGMPGGGGSMPPGASFTSMGSQSFGGGGGGGGGGVDPISMMYGSGGMPGMGQSFSGGGGVADPMSMMFGSGCMPGMSQSFASSSSQHSQQQQQPQQKYDIIPRGTVVSLKGLVNAPDRNGDKGIIQQHNSQTGRYIINLNEDEGSSVEGRDKKTMSIKAGNIQQHIQVKIHNIEHKIELNGTTGTIVSWATSNGRYCIYITSLQELVYLLPGNVILANGTVAQIHGLQSKPELNNTFGTIKEWIRDTNKYDIQLSPQQVIRVKVENVRV